MTGTSSSPGGQNRHARPDENLKRGVTAGRCQRHLRRGNRRSAAQQLIALARLRALRHNVLARWQGCASAASFTCPFAVSTCSSITTASAPCGTGARHDLPCRTLRQLPCRRIARVRAPGNRQRNMRRGFLRAARKAVARRAGKGRLIAICAHWPRKHSARCPAKLNTLRRRPQPADLPGIGCNLCCRFLVAGQICAHALDCRGSNSPWYRAARNSPAFMPPHQRRKARPAIGRALHESTTCCDLLLLGCLVVGVDLLSCLIQNPLHLCGIGARRSQSQVLLIGLRAVRQEARSAVVLGSTVAF